MTTALPFEVWTQILEHAVVLPITQSSHYDPLILPHPVVPRQYVDWASHKKPAALSLTLVCREFREVVRPILYEVIHFTTSSSVWKFADLLDNIFTVAGVPDKTGPHTWTKHLSFDFLETNPSETYRIPMCSIFKHCINVIGLVSKITCPYSILGDYKQSFCAVECIPRGLQFFYFQSTGWRPKKDSFNVAVLKLNSDSLRVIETEDTPKLFTTVPLAKVTHLRTKVSRHGDGIQLQHLPLLTHLRIHNNLNSPFDYQHQIFHDTLLSLHIGQCPLPDTHLQSVLQTFCKLHTLGFHIGDRHGISMEEPSLLFRHPHLKCMFVDAHVTFQANDHALEQGFLALNNYLERFTKQSCPALESITVSCHFPLTALLELSGEICRHCTDLSKRLSAPELQVTFSLGSGE